MILLSICFSLLDSWRVLLQNTNIGKQIASRKKRLRTFACCWWCSCSPYVIRKMWAWHTTAFHKRDHEACTRDALYTKIIYPLTWLKKKRVSESSRIYPGFKIKTESSLCWSFFESYFWKLKDFRSRPISWNAASKQQSSINDVKNCFVFEIQFFPFKCKGSFIIITII